MGDFTTLYLMYWILLLRLTKGVTYKIVEENT